MRIKKYNSFVLKPLYLGALKDQVLYLAPYRVHFLKTGCTSEKTGCKFIFARLFGMLFSFASHIQDNRGHKYFSNK